LRKMEQHTVCVRLYSSDLRAFRVCLREVHILCICVGHLMDFGERGFSIVSLFRSGSLPSRMSMPDAARIARLMAGCRPRLSHFLTLQSSSDAVHVVQ
jgi:hypothetical protein